MRRAFFIALSVSLSCGGGSPALPTSSPPPATYFLAERTDTTFATADHFLASIEMQISGEPFAQLLGRNLAGYDRFNRTPDLYFDPSTGRPGVDTLGYSLAIESYEYSKQPMNNTSFESGAGLALQFGPLLNPNQVSGDAAVALLRDRVQEFALQASAGGAPGTNFVVSPAPVDNPLNVYGWPGFWPAFAEFSSFDTTIAPAINGNRLFCSFTAGYAGSGAAQLIGDYECSYNSLNLPNRDGQVSKILAPDALGYATWKQALWSINYWQTLHDAAGNGITYVADADIPSVGVHGNPVVGKFPDPNDPTGQALIDGVPGVYLGDTVIEGFQGQTMIEEMDNKAALLLRVLLTGDGTTFAGLPTTKEALEYGYTSPLRWWPAQTLVVEASQQPPIGNSWKYFPQPLRFTATDGASHLRGLTSLAGGFATMYALTDFNNPDVGGQPSSRATFDGDPFPADDQLADGEETAHDRALAVIKIALVDVDRLHWDDAHQVLVDTATVSPSGAVQRGTIVSAVDAAWAIIGLRQALRSIGSTLTLYSNDTPDTHGAPTALDAVKLDGATASLPARTLAIIGAEADFLADKLTDDNGAVANSYDVAAGTRDLTPTRIESEASAIRALLDAYLATSNERYRQVAMRIYSDLERRFWMTDVRAFRTVAGESNRIVWTPLAHGTLQGALRQYWKLVARRPGNERVAAELLERVKRQNKLVLNGWDDANGDDVVQYPAECTGAGLQMGERALTGELARIDDRGDRDRDCVVEISVARRPAALAAELVLQRRATAQ